MDRLDYPAVFKRHLHDPRDLNRVTYSFAELLRTQRLVADPFLRFG